MDEYSSPYVSVVPRLLPSQYSSKIPMMDEGYQYNDNRPLSHRSPTTIQNNPLSTRAQLTNNDINNPDPAYPSNQSFYADNSSKGRAKSRLHIEALKDNSGEYLPSNPYSSYGYPPNYDNVRTNPNSENNNCSKVVIIVLVIIIGLFALTSLSISIYLLIKATN